MAPVIRLLNPGLAQTESAFHQDPELSKGEEKTASLIADYLRKLGLEVQTGVAKHGVAALRPGPVGWARSRPERHPAITTLPFVADDSSIPVGIKTMSVVILNYLSRNK